MVVVVPADLMSRGGANEALTLNGASGSDSGDDDLSMSSFLPKMRVKEDLLVVQPEERLEKSKLRKVEKRGGVPISPRAGLFLALSCRSHDDPRTGRR